jgi:hypothetical protein
VNPKLWRRTATFATVTLGLALAAFPSQAQQQQQDADQQSTGDPVADAARKAREQKKKDTAKPKKVYTDDDVNHLVSGAAPVSGDANAAAATDDGAGKNPPPQANDAPGKDANGKDSQPEESAETKWRKQFKEAYDKLDRAEKELDILQREGNKSQVQYYNDPQKALAEQYTRKDINETDTKIAAKKKEIEQMKQRISDMEDALRKSGGDPGWAQP